MQRNQKLIGDSTHAYQSALANYCRNDSFEPIPGVDPERAVHYRRLVFNSIDSALRNAFPLALDCLGEDRWTELVNQFFSTHNPKHPELWRLAGEFQHWFVTTKPEITSTFPFLFDLLEFEWAEIEVFMMPDTNPPATRIRPIARVMDDLLQLNLEHTLLVLEYPVFKVKGEELLAQKGNYALFVYRDPATLRCRFAALPAFLIATVELLKEQPLSGESVYQLFLEFSGLQPDQFPPETAEQLLLQLVGDNIILGSIKIEV